MIFRFDDIAINTDMDHCEQIRKTILLKIPDADILYCVSPLISKPEGNWKTSQRIFPEIWNAMSDHTIFFNFNDCGIPKIPEGVSLAGHGLVHADHRLLNYEAQELSIVGSCSLVKCKIFVPPFNKWNSDTEKVCDKHGIHLIKWESGWRCVEHNKTMEGFDKWYLHSREINIPALEEFLDTRYSLIYPFDANPA